MSTDIKIAVHTAENMHKDNYAPRWIEFLQSRGIEITTSDFRQTNIVNTLRQCHGAMWHWLHSPDDKQVATKIIPMLERNLNLAVFPNLNTCWHYDEKVAQHYLFDAYDIPKIESWVFWNYDEALQFLHNCTYPFVFKMSVGAGSSNVLKVESFAQGKQLLNQIFHQGMFPYTLNEFSKRGNKSIRKALGDIMDAVKYIITGHYPALPDYYLPQKNYFYVQRFIPNNSYDIRVTVIGNRAFGFIRHNRENDFRASGSGNIDYTLDHIPMEAVKLAHAISQKCGFQSMAYDFLCTSNGSIVVNEISYCYVSTAVYNCPGYWDRDLVWHDGHIWPEHAQAEDFLNNIIANRRMV